MIDLVGKEGGLIKIEHDSKKSEDQLTFFALRTKSPLFECLCHCIPTPL